MQIQQGLLILISIINWALLVNVIVVIWNEDLAILFNIQSVSMQLGMHYTWSSDIFSISTNNKQLRVIITGACSCPVMLLIICNNCAEYIYLVFDSTTGLVIKCFSTINASQLMLAEHIFIQVYIVWVVSQVMFTMTKS